jgi:hypothetical protein
VIAPPDRPQAARKEGMPVLVEKFKTNPPPLPAKHRNYFVFIAGTKRLDNTRARNPRPVVI